MNQPCPYLLFLMKPASKFLWIVLFLLFSSSVFADNAREGLRLFEAGKYRQAMAYFMKPDAQKNPDVLNHIGHMYNNGLGVEKNLQTSARWYQKAAEMGFKVAQFNLGLCYQKGEGVDKNLSEAIKWFRKAAEQGYPDAESKMGYFTATGKGIKQDLPEALRWYRLAAEHGDVSSYADIGIFYAKAYGVKKNKNRAVQYYIMGAEKAILTRNIFWGAPMNRDEASNIRPNGLFTGSKKRQPTAAPLPWMNWLSFTPMDC